MALIACITGATSGIGEATIMPTAQANTVFFHKKES